MNSNYCLLYFLVFW